MQFIRSFVFYWVLILATVFIGTACVVVYRFTRSHKKPHLLARLWANINLWTAGVTVQVKGLEHIDPHRTYIYAANHQSWFDIFAIMGRLPVQFRWLAKEELFRIPFLGQGMLAIGHIPIDRSDRRKAFESMNQAAERVREGTSIVIFPEGTRSEDGILQSFRKGGFILAIKSQQPMVPISITGSHSVLPKRGERLIRPGTILMTIGRPIPTAGYTTRDRDGLMERVREAIQEHLTWEEGGRIPAAKDI